MLQLWGVLLLLCMSMRVQGVHWWRRVLTSEGGAAAAMGFLFLLCRRPEISAMGRCSSCTDAAQHAEDGSGGLLQ